MEHAAQPLRVRCRERSHAAPSDEAAGNGNEDGALTDGMAGRDPLDEGDLPAFAGPAEPLALLGCYMPLPGAIAVPVGLDGGCSVMAVLVFGVELSVFVDAGTERETGLRGGATAMGACPRAASGPAVTVSLGRRAAPGILWTPSRFALAGSDVAGIRPPVAVIAVDTLSHAPTGDGGSLCDAIVGCSNLLSLCRPPCGSSILHRLVEAGRIPRASVLIDRRRPPRLNGEPVRLVLGAPPPAASDAIAANLFRRIPPEAERPRQAPDGEAEEERDAVPVASFDGRFSGWLPAPERWGRRGPVVRIERIEVRPPGTAAVVVVAPHGHPRWAFVDLATPACSFDPATLAQLRDALRWGLPRPSVPAEVDAVRRWASSPVWTRGSVPEDAEGGAVDLLDRPEGSCPVVSFYVSRRASPFPFAGGRQPGTVRWDVGRDAYLRRMPEVSATYECPCLPRGPAIRGEARREVGLAFDAMPRLLCGSAEDGSHPFAADAHPSLCVLGNSALAGRAALIDFDTDGLYLFSPGTGADEECPLPL